MGSRRTARELALKILYQLELNRGNLEDILADFWENHVYSANVKNFAENIVRGINEHMEELDKKISRHADNWDFSRIAVIDKNILRIAVYEIQYRDDVPHIVSINEALEVAKKYSTQDSSRFINGVLDAIVKEGKN